MKAVLESLCFRSPGPASAAVLRTQLTRSLGASAQAQTSRHHICPVELHL